MTEIEINTLVPRFLLNDQNGHALAKAVEKGMQIFWNTIAEGIATVENPDEMPEWRLDEKAWELGALYDITADIETKRYWIKNAIPLYASYGTVEAIYNYLRGYFENVEVKENWEYEGQPYHFRVNIDGVIDEKSINWANTAINAIKNTRSILDGLIPFTAANIIISPDSKENKFPYEFCGTHMEETPIGV